MKDNLSADDAAEIVSRSGWNLRTRLRELRDSGALDTNGAWQQDPPQKTEPGQSSEVSFEGWRAGKQLAIQRPAGLITTNGDGTQHFGMTIPAHRIPTDQF
jgi:hypothetical protein